MKYREINRERKRGSYQKAAVPMKLKDREDKAVTTWQISYAHCCSSER